MKKIIKQGSKIIILFYCLTLVYCAVNPVTGKKEIMLISQSMEISMGKKIDQGLRQEYGIYADPRLNAYVAAIGQKIAPHTHRTNLKYHFAVLDTPVQNAFAAPGGYIYITRGLLAMMNSEAELATILGHELGHVNARHSARAMTRNIIFSIGLAVAGELSEDIKKVAPITQIAANLLFLKYSRDNEYEADTLGVVYSRKARYSPPQMVNFFHSIQRLKKMAGGSSLPNFLSTHPLTQKRIDKVKAQLQPPDRQLAIRKNGYIQKINGMVYGLNPRQGYVQNNRFFHPDMKFSFRIPAGWRVQNTPQRVMMGPKNGQAIIILMAQSSQQKLDQYANTKMTGFKNTKLLSKGFRRINNLNAYHTLFNITPSVDNSNQPGKITTVLLSNIRKENYIFTFFSSALDNHFKVYQKVLGSTVNSFKTLNDPSHLNKQPARVRVVRVPRAQQLQQYLTTQRISQKLWPHITLINGMELTAPLTANQLIKIIR